MKPLALALAAQNSAAFFVSIGIWLVDGKTREKKGLDILGMALG